MANRAERIKQESPWLTPAEAAAYLKVGRTYIRKNRLKLGGMLLGGKHWRYHREALDRHLINPRVFS